MCMLKLMIQNNNSYHHHCYLLPDKSMLMYEKMLSLSSVFSFCFFLTFKKNFYLLVLLAFIFVLLDHLLLPT